MLLFLPLLLFALLISFPVHPIFAANGWDKVIFRYIGMVVHEGGAPYKDAFDHKPPLIYFFNALTFDLDGSNAWLAETILLAIAAFILWKTAVQRRWPLPYLFGIYLISLQRTSDFFSNGGLTRGLDAIFISIVLCIYLKKPKYQYLYWGILTAIVFFFQQNDAVALAVPYLFSLFRNKTQPKQIIKNISITIFGFFLITVPICIWFILKGAWQDFVNCAFLVNTNVYAFHVTVVKLIFMIKDTLSMHYFQTWILITAGLLIGISKTISLKQIMKEELIPLFIGLLTQVAFLNITGVVYLHYFLPLVVWLLIISGEMLRLYKFNFLTEKHQQAFMIVLTLAVLYCLPNKNIGHQIQLGTTAIKRYLKGDTTPLVVSNNLRERIEPLRRQKGSFYVFGDVPALNLNTYFQIIAPTKWCYVFFWNQVDLRIWDPQYVKFKSILSDLDHYSTKYVLDFTNTNKFNDLELQRIWQEYRDQKYKFIEDSDGGKLYQRI